MSELDARRAEVDHPMLAERERIMRAVFDSTSDAMLLFDDYGVLNDVNPAACELFGRSGDELVGHIASDFYRSDFDVRAQRDRFRVDGEMRGELTVVRPDGAGRRVDFRAKAHIAAGLNLAVMRDITERQRAEEALRVAEAQLRQAQKMEAVGALAGGVAHDFNNLLSVILSYTHLVLSELKPGDPLHADIDEVRRAGERAADLTRQLLAFSRQQMLAPRVLNLGEVVRGMEKMLRRLIGEDIELSLLTSRSLGSVSADPGQMEQIVLNLAVNARDAMPSGGKLSIEASNVDLDEAYAATHHGVAPGRYVMLACTDTGVGIDAATRDRIFEPFFTTKEQGRGTGLGLSTVFGIVKQSQGHIWVYSEPGVGTTFKVYLPRVDEELPTNLTTPPPSPTTMEGAETILLVEDEEQVRVMARTVLRRCGYNVLDAANGGEAFLICEQFRAAIHLLVTDVVMPRMSGRELAERLAPLRPEMRVLFLSGYTRDSIVHHGVLDAGISFLQKPLTPDALARKVREVLDAVPSSRRARPNREGP